VVRIKLCENNWNPIDKNKSLIPIESKEDKDIINSSITLIYFKKPNDITSIAGIIFIV